MALNNLKIAVWNANGLANHTLEIKIFLVTHNIDIMLISESHLTNRSHIKIPQYTTYNTQHPDGTGHGGTAIIIKSSIKHYELSKYSKNHLQATSIAIQDWKGQLVISAVYCQPKPTIKEDQFALFYQTLGHRFIAGGDYNAKHPLWGSRLTTPRGRQLFQALTNNNLQHLATGEPTYWPTDRRKVPDAIDFCVTKGISSNYLEIKSCFELSSDHSPLLVNVNTQVISNSTPPLLHNKTTDWEVFRNELNENLQLNLSLKTPDEMDTAIEHFNRCIQQAAWAATSVTDLKTNIKRCPSHIKEMIAEKRRLRKRWQTTRAPEDKRKLNQAIKQVKVLLGNDRNLQIQEYLAGLSATEANGYSLWKATKKLKQLQKSIPPIRKNDDTWARDNNEKAYAFADHLAKVFEPFPSQLTAEEERQTHQILEAPFQMDFPIKTFKVNEVKKIIMKHTHTKKAPGYDLITGKILQELPECGFYFITIISNSILRLGYVPSQWKVAEIKMIQKPGKPAEEVSSYRPISLLPVVSKIFEKLLLQRLLPILEAKNMIPKHQFGFRQKHSTIEQVHRVAKKIRHDLETGRYCSAAFLDVSMAFDKVWHEGLLYKIKTQLPYNYYQILQSYLADRYFMVKYQDVHTSLFPIKAGVPQGSVLGPILYLLYTADLPKTRLTSIATFADDTAILASSKDPRIASQNLQKHLIEIQKWFKHWRIKVNELKSVHVTFTLKKNNCPTVQLNNCVLPQKDAVKYLGMHLDRRLTWQTHIFTKRKQLGLQFSKMYWLIGRKSQMSLENKVLLYKAILKPVWTYGIQLWGSASESNIAILQRFQSKVLRSIVDAPWFVPNVVIHNDLHIETVKSEIKNLSAKYKDRLQEHPNALARALLSAPSVKRLKRFDPLDLPNRA